MQLRKESSVRNYRGAFVCAMLSCAIATLAGAPSYAASVTTTVHQASGYGAEVNVGSAVKVGPVAVAELPT